MPNPTLRRQARKMVFDVYIFMKSESPMSSEKDILKRTADATQTSESTIRRIVMEYNECSLLHQFRTPGKRRSGKKTVTGLDVFDHTAIKRCVHNFHVINNEVPTVEKLRKKLKDDIDFKGSERSLRRILNDLGFRWKRIQSNKRILIEKTNIRLSRIEYLQRLMKFKEEGRPIIYTDESFVDSPPKSYSVGSSKGLKPPVSKLQRLIIVHAGTEAGFIPNALLLFKAGTKTGDYRDSMNCKNYEKWMRSLLIPNLPPNSVVVLDNASSHNKQHDPAPTANSKKAVMQQWLRDKNIQFEDNMLKPQLYKKIKKVKDEYRHFSVDKLLMEHNHTVLRLPPHHPDLNPMEMVWAAIKGYIASKNITCDTNQLKELVIQKVTAMGASEWKTFIDKVKTIEAEYVKSDHVVDLATEQFLIVGSDDSSSDDDDDDEYEDEDEIYGDINDPLKSTNSSPTFGFMEGTSILPDE